MSGGAASRAGGSRAIARSPADVLRLVAAAVVVVVVLLVELLVGDALVEFASDLLRGLDALPQWIVDVIVIGTRVLAVIVLGGGLCWTLYRRRWRLLISTVAAAALAVALFAVLDWLVDTDPGRDLVETGPSLGPLTSDASVSTAGVAAVAAVLTAAAPWMSRRWREIGWVLVLGLSVLTFLQADVSFDTIVAVATGWLSGAVVLVAAGAPSRRPTVDAVIAGLRSVGLRLAQLERAGVDARGSTPYFGTSEDGTRLFIKALGTDERSADLLFRLYRRVQPHDLGDERPFESLRRSVEHEAFAAMSASAVGVRTPPLRALAMAEPNGYVLAYERIEGKSLDRLEPAAISDDVLRAVWDLVGQLRRHRIAHRDLRLANIFLDDTGQAWIIDFGFSEVAARDLLLATDVVELLASSSVCVGSERAVAHAVRAVDGPTLAAAVDRLHRWALSGATRTAVAAHPGLLADLRARVTDAATSSAEGRPPR
jgi:tRNA A-37 threonylcarbamoyl transferase component Bud32